MLPNSLKKNFTLLFVLILIWFSVFSEPTKFSIIFYNLLPIRILLPILISTSFIFFFKKKDLYILLKDKIFLVLLLFLLVKIVSGFVTVDYGSYFGLVAFWSVLTLFYVSLFFQRDFIKTQPFIFYFSYISLMLFVNILSFAKYFYFVYQNVFPIGTHIINLKISHVIADENHYSFFLLVGIFVMISFIRTYTKNKILIAASIFSIFTSSAFIVATESRTGILSFSLGVGFYLFLELFRSKRKKFVRESVYPVMYSVLAILIGILVGWFVIDPYTNTNEFYMSGNNADSSKNLGYIETYVNPFTPRNSSQYPIFQKFLEGLPGFLNEPSFKAHLVLLYSSFEMAWDSPVLGVGVGSFDESLKSSDLINIFARYDPRSSQSAILPPHSMYGEALAETGFVGLAIYLVLLYLLGKKYLARFLAGLLQNKSFLSQSLLAMFVSFMFFTIFYNLNEEWFFIPLFLGLFYTES